MNKQKPEEILQKAREAKGHTQQAFAQKLGISARMYQRYEKGDFPKFKAEVVHRIDKLLETNLYDMIYEQNVPREKVGEIEIPDAIQLLSEKVLLIEAGMEVERSMLIDLLAQATGRTTTEITTEVAKALDYQISKRKAALKSTTT